jgi:putative FmdB family regulatory protein
MPAYEYKCSACNREFEYQQRMSDPEMVRCEACGEDKLERLISWTSVRSNGWKGAMFEANPREAIKGSGIVDRSRSHRFTGAEPAPSTEPAPAPVEEATTEPEPRSE